MIIVSSQELLLWIEDQLSLGGDKESLYMLVDLVGGISRKEINTLRISPLEKVEIRVKLSFLSNKWKDHINNQIPIQYYKQKKVITTIHHITPWKVDNNKKRHFNILNEITDVFHTMCDFASKVWYKGERDSSFGPESAFTGCCKKNIKI